MSTTATSRPSKVVVGVDGSDCSKNALRWAAFIAGQAGAQLEVVAAWHFPPTFGLSHVPPTFSPGDMANKALNETVEEVFGGNRPVLVIHGDRTPPAHSPA